MRWYCNKHVFEWTANAGSVVTQRTWCPMCAKNLLVGLECCRTVAKERGGICLSRDYVNSKTTLRWRCAKGHEWDAAWSGIRCGRWCPNCSSLRPVGIERCKQEASAHGGECLSVEYKNSGTKLYWRCMKGHKWYSTWVTVHSGHWCPICAKTRRGIAARKGIEACKKLASIHDVECLSTEYTSNSTKMHWCCVDKHGWWATWSEIRTRPWCPICRAKKTGRAYKTNIEDCKQTASGRGYRCLSEKYVNGIIPMRWWCGSCGREWKTSWSSIKQGSGCPYCHAYDMESRCRVIFETIFEVPFPKSRPFKESGSLLEIDGYNESLAVAFEYDGHQHRTGKMFNCHKINPSIFERDQTKNALCKQNNIHLMRINDLEATQETLVDVIINKLEKDDINFPPLSEETLSRLRVPCNSIYKQIWGTTYLQTLREVCNSHIDTASGRRGELLSADAWAGTYYKYDIQCEFGHIFGGSYGHIRGRHGWCPVCAGRCPVDIERCRQKARVRGGECLSTKCISAKTKMSWRCARGHEWSADWDHIKRGQWCPVCARLRL